MAIMMVAMLPWTSLGKLYYNGDTQLNIIISVLHMKRIVNCEVYIIQVQGIYNRI